VSPVLYISLHVVVRNINRVQLPERPIEPIRS
jgi:hypothetical protein